MSDSSNRCRLREVDLSWTAITDCSLKLLGNAAKGSLTKVKARGCSFQGRKTVTNEGVCALAACGNLRVLKMYDYGHVTDAAILKLAECCADVTELSVPSCYSLTDEAVINAAGLWGDLSAIDISGILFISDASLKALAAFCPLRDLRICGCRAVTDHGIAELAACKSDLRRVDVSCCDALTDTAIRLLAKRHASSLESLQAANCPLISDEGVVEAVTLCERLALLNLNNCPAVTDVTLAAFSNSRAALTLTDLWLRGAAVTLPGIQRLLADAKSLQELQLSPQIFQMSPQNSDSEDGEERWRGFNVLQGTSTLHLRSDRLHQLLPPTYR